jgi:hypothetical protein
MPYSCPSLEEEEAFSQKINNLMVFLAGDLEL